MSATARSYDVPDELAVECIDLAGNEAPVTMPFSILGDIYGLPDSDIDHILDMWAEGHRSAYIGEREYRQRECLTEAELAEWLDGEVQS
jgi:hypothetical protein